MSRPRLALHIVLLVVFLHGTVPLLFSEPRYAWVYKHFGVVDYINHTGRVSSGVDIYQSWPAFFAVAAWLTRIAGVADPARYAAWAQVYFNLLAACAFAFLASALTTSSRTRWMAVFVFVAANWAGQDYFAPQAFAFVLCLVIFGILVRWCLVPGSGRSLRRLDEAGARLVRGPPTVACHPAPQAPRHHLAAAMAILALFTVVVASHQLSPYLVIIAVGLLTLGGVVRPRWLIVALTVVAVGYLAPHFAYVNRNFGLLDSVGSPFRSSVTDGVGLGQGMPGRVFTANAARLLSVGVWTLAVAGAIRRWRAGLPSAHLLVLAASPAVIILAQSYGGEAIYRVFLFALPWTAFLAAEALAPGWRPWGTRPAALSTVAVLVVLTLFVPSYFGLDEVNRIRPTEVAAAEYFYTQTDPGTVLVLAGPNFPGRLNAGYAQHVTGTSDPLLLTSRPLRGHTPGPDDLPAIDNLVAASQTDRARAGYLVVSTSMKVYWREFGIGPPGALDDLEQLLGDAPRWRTVYRNADAVIFELLPPAAPAAGT